MGPRYARSTDDGVMWQNPLPRELDSFPSPPPWWII